MSEQYRGRHPKKGKKKKVKTARQKALAKLKNPLPKKAKKTYDPSATPF